MIKFITSTKYLIKYILSIQFIIIVYFSIPLSFYREIQLFQVISIKHSLLFEISPHIALVQWKSKLLYIQYYTCILSKCAIVSGFAIYRRRSICPAELLWSCAAVYFGYEFHIYYLLNSFVYSVFLNPKDTVNCEYLYFQASRVVLSLILIKITFIVDLRLCR